MWMNILVETQDRWSSSNSIQQHQGVQQGPWRPCLPSKIGSFAEHICIRHDRSTCQKPVKRSRFVQQILTFVNEIDDSE